MKVGRTIPNYMGLLKSTTDFEHSGCWSG